ncbi:unnamed protein product [Nesidiocoris tenuis]|uniref:EGF domain-specific O-linked N-acetylglucosamine transferase n=1 Tax=Nesidiocoris tenuis TaxID=355587 RepID=A0A6H5H3Y5_9HEMI|nr:unnamed protein product [Nesidiocoris tenuis]
MLFLILMFKFISTTHPASSSWKDLNLPETHLPYYFSNFPVIGDECLADDSCPYKDAVTASRSGSKKCWGYERGCPKDAAYSRPDCSGDHKGWVRSKEEQEDTFYRQGDFGYVKERLDEMSVICEPTFREDSSLECSKHLRFCRGRNIRIDFGRLANRTELLRYKMDVLGQGDISGKCRLHQERLDEECDQISPLQSWGPELRYFTTLDAPLSHEKDCDVVVERPTYILKIDAAVNMYHHFCDFFNLYASQHLNSSHPSAFSTDVHIIIWESYRYNSNFMSTFEAFTRHPLWDLNTFRGRKVCFSNVVFPLLPRMIFGLYYNTPIIWGCEGSGLFHAFSEHVLHRLKIPLHPAPLAEVDGTVPKLRVTFLARESSYRNVLNEKKLLDKLRRDERYEVQRVVFNSRIPFKRQLEIVRNSDIFIGIHGAGLAHLLFLPGWAAVFELYNCEDESCYLDLARLRGVGYFTWEKKAKVWPQDEGHHPEGGAHAKFTNYKFDPAEFLRLVSKAAKHVLRHPAYRKFVSLKPLKDEL